MKELSTNPMNLSGENTSAEAKGLSTLTLVLIIVGSVCCLIAVGLSIFLFVRSKNNNNDDDDYVARDMSTTHYQGLQVNEGGSLPQQGNSIYSDASLTDNGGEYNAASFAGSVDAYQNLQLSPLTNAYGRFF